MLVKYQLYYTIIINFVLMVKITNSAHIDGNNSDIFVSYSGHSEVNMPNIVSEQKIVENKEFKPVIAQETTEAKTEADVFFIPNEKPVIRNDYLDNDAVKITDVMNERNLKIGDIINDKSATEPANEDILFISGSNNENVEKIDKKRKHEDSITKKPKTTKLNCSNLDCNNTVESVCGGKIDNKKWKYRLFMNECFFRKVNCAFKYPSNRYILVEMNKCKHIGSHSIRRPDDFQPIALPLSDLEETRRSFASRRSLNTNMNGISCAHTCPIACTEKYEPQCAATPSGQHKTFLNHCQLDYHSCVYNIEWQIRPLSECVGGKKADMRQNRGFIAWMQKVGIVDNRGRLVLS
ncbi:uncharacterized protein [Epargyreus clarus]|uniref:uncharacterized protein n=1 Tax=Epargyreus clarus TaxID=520877 RepID=UPI003C2D93EC